MIRHGNPPYLECSSSGDKRFSAFYAKVNGKSIEEQYQSAKIFCDGPENNIESYSHFANWKNAKGKKAYNQKEISILYSQLWDQYIDEHPDLLKVLISAPGLKDIFGQVGHCCQATELWRIRTETLEERLIC